MVKWNCIFGVGCTTVGLPNCPVCSAESIEADPKYEADFSQPGMSKSVRNRRSMQKKTEKKNAETDLRGERNHSQPATKAQAFQYSVHLQPPNKSDFQEKGWSENKTKLPENKEESALTMY